MVFRNTKPLGVIGSTSTSDAEKYRNFGTYWSNATTAVSSVPVSIGTLNSAWSNTAAGYSDPNTELRREIEQLKDLFFMKAVVPCAHCGQYGAAGCACKHCGAPIGYTKPNPEKELNSLLQTEIQCTQAKRNLRK